MVAAMAWADSIDAVVSSTAVDFVVGESTARGFHDRRLSGRSFRISASGLNFFKLFFPLRYYDDYAYELYRMGYYPYAPRSYREQRQFWLLWFSDGVHT